MEQLQQELHEAIEKWRETWKTCSLEEVLQLYSEDVRVMRSGVGLIRGRAELKATLQRFSVMGLADIDFYSDEIGGFGGGDINGDGALAYQRYHEVAVREDGSEISTIHGFMIWKRVAGMWMIEMYANCQVTPDATNTTKLRESIQQAFNQFGQTWTSRDVDEAMKYFSSDCSLTVGSPPNVFKGKEAISGWLKQMSANGCSLVNLMVDRVIPIAEVYIVSQLVYVSCPTITILDKEGRVVMTGCGNAIVRRVGESWEICEALWNITDA